MNAAVPSPQRVVWQRFRGHRLALLSGVVVTVLLVLAAAADLVAALTGWKATDVDLQATLIPPLTAGHVLGTDELGRDVLMRLIYGGQVSLSVGIVSAFSGALIGTAVGLIAGYYGGVVDAVLMRLTDAALSIPLLPLMIVFSALDPVKLFGGATLADGVVSALLGALLLNGLVALSRRGTGEAWRGIGVGVLGVFVVLMVAWLVLFRVVDWRTLGKGSGGGAVQLILLIVLFGWMTVARLARAATLQIKSMEYITATRALGATDARILLRHVLPNALAPIIVATTLEVGANILYEAALSFLGLGIKPPTPSWGNMLTNAQDYIYRAPLLALWPGLLILTTVASFNFLGDGLRDALDPRRVIKR
ncbi:MAG: ABC transporter permease [Myxococcota bacterium]